MIKNGSRNVFCSCRHVSSRGRPGVHESSPLILVFHVLNSSFSPLNSMVFCAPSCHICVSLPLFFCYFSHAVDFSLLCTCMAIPAWPGISRSMYLLFPKLMLVVVRSQLVYVPSARCSSPISNHPHLGSREEELYFSLHGRAICLCSIHKYWLDDCSRSYALACGNYLI